MSFKLSAKQKAVFLDRDDTVLKDPGYLAHPDGVVLLPGVEHAIIKLREAGFKIVLVTNQSGVARGMFDEAMLERIHAELRNQLVAKGAILDAIYYCPFHPDGKVEKYTKESDLRKPNPGMLLQAAEQLDLDLANSWMVGDSNRDVEAGRRAGCKGSILLTGKTVDPENMPDTNADHVVADLTEAACIIMRSIKADTNASVTAPMPGELTESTPLVTDSEVIATAKTEEDLIAAIEEKTNEAAEKSGDKIIEKSSDINNLNSVETKNSTVKINQKSYVSHPTTANEKNKQPQQRPAMDQSQTQQDVAKKTLPVNVVPSSHQEKSNYKSDAGKNKKTSSDDEIRKEILQHVRLISKMDYQDEFSLVTMLGGIAQMVSMLFLGILAYHYFKDAKPETMVLAGLVSLIFQVMSLTFFTMSKGKR